MRESRLTIFRIKIACLSLILNQCCAEAHAKPLFRQHRSRREELALSIYVFRLAPVCGRLRGGKSFLHVADWSVQPCVRPTSAVHMTAGHNALRGSGPDRKPAFEKCIGASGLS